MNVTLVISQLGCGGAERVCTLLAQDLHARGFTCSVITLSTRHSDFYSLPPAVDRLKLDFFNKTPHAAAAFAAFVKGNTKLRRALADTAADCVISFMDKVNIHCAVAARRLNVPLIATVHIHPQYACLDWRWRCLRRFTYPLCDRIVCVSRGIRSALPWLPEHKCPVIYNPIPSGPRPERPFRPPPGLDTNRRWVLSVGRLTPQKGYDVLLKAFHRVHKRCADWNLVILGEGDCRDSLEALAARLGIADRIMLPGQTKDVLPYYSACDLFVLPSRFEGFGNVLVEAMSAGMPVISTDCPSGPAEIISHGENGWLVPVDDVGSLAAMLAATMEDPELRRRIGGRALSVAERYALDRVGSTWADLIVSVAGSRNA